MPALRALSGQDVRGYGWTTSYSRSVAAALWDGSARATYITISVGQIERDYPTSAGVTEDEKFLATTSHEFMHALQYAFDVTDTRDFHWLGEATATWAEDHIYPSLGTEHEDAPAFLELPQAPLNLVNGQYEYGAYLYPFYLVEKHGNPGIVGQMWQNGESTGSLAAVDAATPGGFDAVWGEFAAAIWDAKLTPDFQADGLVGGVYDPNGDGEGTMKPSPILLSGGEQLAHTLDLGPGVSFLSAQYFSFDLTAPDLHAILFANGFSFDLDRAVPTGMLDETWFARRLDPARLEGREVWAIVKAGGEWQQPVDVTDVALIPFCQDYASERIEELVIVFANSRFEGDLDPLRAPGMDSTLFTTNVACGDWEGSAQVVKESSDFGRIETTQAFMELAYTREQHTIAELLDGAGDSLWLPDGAIVPFDTNVLLTGLTSNYTLEDAEVIWATEVLSGVEPAVVCTTEGTGLLTEEDLRFGVFDLRPNLYTVGPDASLPSLYRSYFLSAAFLTPLDAAAVETKCTDGTVRYGPFGIELATGLGELLVSTDGQSIEDSWTSDDGTTTYDLQLEGVR